MIWKIDSRDFDRVAQASDEYYERLREREEQEIDDYIGFLDWLEEFEEGE